jgi:hypothetical protein
VFLAQVDEIIRPNVRAVGLQSFDNAVGEGLATLRNRTHVGSVFAWLRRRVLFRYRNNRLQRRQSYAQLSLSLPRKRLPVSNPARARIRRPSDSTSSCRRSATGVVAAERNAASLRLHD